MKNSGLSRSSSISAGALKSAFSKTTKSIRDKTKDIVDNNKDIDINEKTLTAMAISGKKLKRKPSMKIDATTLKTAELSIQSNGLSDLDFNCTDLVRYTFKFFWIIEFNQWFKNPESNKIESTFHDPLLDEFEPTTQTNEDVIDGSPNDAEDVPQISQSLPKPVPDPTTTAATLALPVNIGRRKSIGLTSIG